MWRKTRQPHAHLCYGTDANRNFNFHWMGDYTLRLHYCTLTLDEYEFQRVERPRTRAQKLMLAQQHFPNRKLWHCPTLLDRLQMKSIFI